MFLLCKIKARHLHILGEEALSKEGGFLEEVFICEGFEMPGSGFRRPRGTLFKPKRRGSYVACLPTYRQFTRYFIGS